MDGEVRTGWNGWRVVRWGIAAALLLTPAVMMQVSDEWNWGPASFVLAGVMTCGPILAYERTARLWPSLAYRGGVAVALVVSFLLIWINLAVGIVGEDNPINFSFFMLIFASGVGAFAARLKPDGMARAMLGTAAVQVLLAIAIATAPSTRRGWRAYIVRFFCGAVVGLGCLVSQGEQGARRNLNRSCARHDG